MSDTLKAGVQYGDWEGTAAADNADDKDLWGLLRERGLAEEGEFLLAAKMWIGENHVGKVAAPTITAVILPEHEDIKNYDNVDAFMKAHDGELPTRTVNLELTIEEFIALYKRFSVVLTHRGLNLEGREYSVDA